LFESDFASALDKIAPEKSKIKAKGKLFRHLEHLYSIMKRKFAAIIFLVFGLFVFSSSTSAQRNIEPQVERDPILEADAKHNLEVAWQYFKLKKAYKAVLMRTEETIAAHPLYSKMDEILYLSGMSSFYLSQNKGKQKIDFSSEEDKQRFAPEKLREDAVAYLSQLVEQHPQSKYKDDAEKVLKLLKAAK
jgi:outer membrane protein assembly factor BamD (BamD/ComL family)